jgi:DNA-binding transcriptional MerR regulator
MSFRIKTVERLTGLSRNTITAWERRYNLIEPGRDDSGYRTYSEGDVALLRAIKHKLDEGYAIREAINIARGAPESVPVEVGSTSELLDALLQCLLDLDRGCAEEIHARLLALPYRTRVDDVYLPLLRRVGDLWAQGGANVAQEHFTSAFCRDHLVGMLQNVGHGPEDGPLAVCAGYPGEPHELGLLAVAVKLALRGFRVMWLGADLPAADLIAACQGLAPVLVCQSVIQPLPSAQILAHADVVRAGIERKALLVFGGPAVAGLVSHDADLLFCPTLDDLLDRRDELRTRTVRLA